MNGLIKIEPTPTFPLPRLRGIGGRGQAWSSRSTLAPRPLRTQAGGASVSAGRSVGGKRPIDVAYEHDLVLANALVLQCRVAWAGCRLRPAGAPRAPPVASVQGRVEPGAASLPRGRCTQRSDGPVRPPPLRGGAPPVIVALTAAVEASSGLMPEGAEASVRRLAERECPGGSCRAVHAVGEPEVARLLVEVVVGVSAALRCCVPPDSCERGCVAASRVPAGRVSRPKCRVFTGSARAACPHSILGVRPPHESARRPRLHHLWALPVLRRGAHVRRRTPRTGMGSPRRSCWR